MASAGVAYVDIFANWGPFEASTAKLPASVGTKMQTLGKSLTKYVSLPLAALGVASAKMAADFQRSMLLIHTSAGASKKEVKELEKYIENLGTKVPQSLNELSAAAYRIEGGGIHGQKAKEALKEASDFAVVQHTNVEETAKSVTQVAFAKMEGSAENFRKIVAGLNATIGAGDLKGPNLIDALGTGLPAASKVAGLTFEQMDAALALIGDNTTNVSGQAAQLGTAFHYLYNPTEKAAEALASIGLKQTSLAVDLKNGGLYPALKDLKEHLEELPGGVKGVAATQILGDILPGGRGRILLTFINELSRLKEKGEDIGKTMGQFPTSVKEAFQGPAVKAEIAWNGLKTSLTKLGKAILPAVIPTMEKIGEKFGELGDKFSKLSPDTQQWIVKIGLAAIALGPVLIIAGKIYNLFKRIGSMVGSIISAAKKVVGVAVPGVGKTESPEGEVEKKLSERGSGPDNPMWVKESSLNPSELGGGNPAADAEEGAGAGGAAEGAAGAADAASALALPVAVAATTIVAGHLSTTKWGEEILGRDAKKEHEAAIHQSIRHQEYFKGPPQTGAGPFASTNVFQAKVGTPGGEKAISRSFAKQKAETVHGLAELSGLYDNFQPLQGNDPLGLAKATAREFQQAGGVTRQGIEGWLREVEELKPGSRESAIQSINGMVKAWASGHPKLEAQFDRLTQAEKQKFGGTNKEVEASTASAMAHLSNSAREGATNVGGALNNIFDNLANALAAVGSSKIPAFTLSQLSIASSYHATREATESGLGPIEKQRGGPINLGAPSGDSVPALLERGEYVLNRNAVSAVGVRKLDALNFGAASRFQTGGLAKERISGPEPLAGLGQNVAERAHSAAATYLRKHSEPERILRALKATEVLASRGFPYVYGGGHGGFGIQPVDCSGLVSYTLHAAGFIDSPMSVQQGSGLYTLGSPGPGKYLTWGVRGTSGENAHTMDAIKAPGGRWKFFESGGSTGAGAHEDSGWDGNFQFRHMPGFQTGGEVGMPKKAREAIAKFGQEAFDPHSKHFVGWGFQKGGLIPQLLATGGRVITGKVSWFNGGPTAGGKNTADPGIAVNLHPGTEGGWNNAITQGWMKKSKAGDPVVASVSIQTHKATLPIIDLGPAGFTERAIDVTEGGVSKLGFSTSSFPTDATGTATIGGHESAKEEKEHTYKEEVPATYKGCSTKSLHFPSVPTKNRKGIEREITRWANERDRFRAAITAAKKANRPGVAQDLQHNLTDITHHLAELRNAKVKLRQEEARKHFSKLLKRKFSKLTGYETAIEQAQQAYEKRGQFAEQVVDLEPLQPELVQAPGETDTAYEKRQKESEEGYVKKLTGYIEGSERPAYRSVLESENTWRDEILGAEQFAAGDWQKQNFLGGFEGHFEDNIVANVENQEVVRATIRRITEAIKKWREENKGKELPEGLAKELREREKLIHDKLPYLRFKEGELRSTLGEARGLFYPGKAEGGHSGFELRTNPPVPAIGSGSFEDALKEVQGIHWPDQHEVLGALPPNRVAGAFGGAIWDTQTAIEELGLKVSQAANSIAGTSGSEESADSERLQIVEELLRQGNERAAVTELDRETLSGASILPPFAGKAHTGAIVPGPPTAERTMVVKGREGIFTEEQMAALAPSSQAPVASPVNVHLHVDRNAGVDVDKLRVEIEDAFGRKERVATRGSRSGLARAGFRR